MNHNKQKKYNDSTLLLPAGITLLVSGGSILLDQSLKTGWLSQAVVIAAGFLLLAGGLLLRSLFWTLAGSLFTTLGAGSFFMLQEVQRLWNVRLGGFLAFFGLGWLAVFLFAILLLRRQPWWMLLPGGLGTALSLCFLFSRLRVLDFVLYVGLGIALPLLIWGAFKRLFGLIIAGCLLLGASSGVYMGWGGAVESADLAQTGIMLVIFGLGWLLITLFSRVITQHVVWWPLIPGTILAVVGWGLYIGGNPSNALTFISNTGSIALMLFGIYLILLRRSIR